MTSTAAANVEEQGTEATTKTTTTEDLYAAAFLMLHGWHISRVEPSPNREKWHHLVMEADSAAPDAGALLPDYFMGKATVEPRAYINRVMDVKTAIYNEKKVQPSS